jgi:hypothetical protein
MAVVPLVMRIILGAFTLSSLLFTAPVAQSQSGLLFTLVFLYRDYLTNID